MLHVVVQDRERGCSVGVGQRRNRLARQLLRPGVVVVVRMMLVVSGVVIMFRMIIVTGVRILAMMLMSGVIIAIAVVCVIVMGVPVVALRQCLPGCDARAQRGGEQGAGQGSGGGAHSTTRTSRIMPASMW